MNINTKYIYISFTTFTNAIFNIFVRCKYCKYEKTSIKALMFNGLNQYLVNFHIYKSKIYNTLIFCYLQNNIYHIYHIYTTGYRYSYRKLN